MPEKNKRTDKNYKTKIAPAIKKSVPISINSQNPEKFEKETVHEVYEEIASHFSLTRNVPWPLVKLFIDDINKQQNKIILDDGAGNGKYSKLFTPQNITIAIDYSFNLCQIAKTSNQLVINADGLHLPIKSNSVNYAISVAVLHHLSTEERRQEYLNELFRVMAPGATGLISVWAFEQETISTASDQDRYVPWTVNKSDQERCNIQVTTVNRFYHFFKKNELINLLKQSGFKIQSEKGKTYFEQIYGPCDLQEEYLDHDNWYCIFFKPKDQNQ